MKNFEMISKNSKKLLAIDLDGTLLTDNNEISQQVLENLKEAEKNNITICIVTGRTITTALNLMNKYSFNYHLICYNGAKILDFKNRKECFYKGIEKKHASMIIDFCLKEKLALHVFGESFWGVTKTNELVERYSQYVNEKPNIIRNLYDLEKAEIINLVGVENVDLVEDYICKNSIDVSFTKSDPLSIDIMGKDVTKGSALRTLASILGFEKKQIISIGNYFNDIDMFKESGIGIAVQNAPEGVKIHADYVTKNTNNNDGVGEAISKFILQI